MRSLTEEEKRKINREKIAKEPKGFPFKGKVLGKKKTRRAKKKKPDWVIESKRKKDEALKLYKKQAKERWEQYQKFQRLIN